VASIHNQRPGTAPPVFDAVIFAGVSGLVAVGSLAVLVLNVVESGGQGMLAAIICLGSASLGGAAMLAVGINTIRREMAVVAYHLTPTAMERHRNNRLAAAYPYDAFTSVRMIQSQRVARRARPRLDIYPAILVQGDFDAFELAISYGKLVSEHDTRALLQDLLPRLPASVEIESVVRVFAETGDRPELAKLPEG
jgi:hypothetical protein